MNFFFFFFLFFFFHFYKNIASLCCLIDFREQFPTHRRSEVDRAIERGRQFVRDIQRPDGSWYGSWACCFTYGTWFGIEALVYGLKKNHPIYQSTCVQNAIKFLLKKQNRNGGWGEDFTSCYDKEYALHGAEVYGTGGSSIPCTSWALLALLAANCQEIKAMERGELCFSIFCFSSLPSTYLYTVSILHIFTLFMDIFFYFFYTNTQVHIFYVRCKIKMVIGHKKVFPVYLIVHVELRTRSIVMFLVYGV